MIFLKAARQMGKTTKLIKLANRDWKYIVCLDRQRADFIARHATSMGLDIPYPITIRELPIRSPYVKSVLLDDTEDILQALVGKRIDYATLHSDLEEVKIVPVPEADIEDKPVICDSWSTKLITPLFALGEKGNTVGYVRGEERVVIECNYKDTCPKFKNKMCNGNADNRRSF